MRLSHLAAVATLVALLGAMFVSVGSVSAAGCVANPGINLSFNGSCDLDVADIHDDATNLVEVIPTDGSAILTIAKTAPTDDPETAFMISAGTTGGSRSINVLGDLGDDDAVGGTGGNADEVLDTIAVTVAGFGIAKVEVVGDTDNRVSAGSPVVARVTIRSAHSAAEVRLTVPTTGLSIDTTTSGQSPTTSQVQEKPVPDSSADAPLGMVDFTVNTAGAPAGEYVLTFTADNDGDFTDQAGTEESDKRVTTSLRLTISDPGTGLSSATLSLGNSSPDIPYTADNEAVAETGTAPAVGGEGINLVIEVFDSLGGEANPGSIDQIIVIAPGGNVTVNGRDETMGVMSNQSGATIREYDDDDDANNADTIDNVGAKTTINVKKSGGSSAKPGMVTVYAIVSGSGGAATTESLTLNFSGMTSSISIGDATDTLRSVNVDADDSGKVEDDERDSITLAVTGADDGGIANDPGEGFNITITGPDGKRVNSNKIEAMLATAYAGGKRDLTLTGKGAPGAALMAGEYTVMLKKGSLEASAMFSVAGSASDVMVSASATTSDTIGDVITVTAEITDADGNPVSDGTSVQFDVSSNTGLAAIGTGHMGKDTKDGMASVKYAVVGAGHSVVSATAGGATGVIVIDSTAGMVEPEAMPEEEASVSCLSELSGFATWSCGVEADASAIFDMVTGRGVSAIHLWNGSTWVRYSVVDDAMVPGSSDFMVTENDILYISN